LLEKTYEPGEMPFSCRFLNWMEKMAIKHADGRTAPSHDLAQRIEKWCGFPTGGVVPIPNPVDTDWFCPNSEYEAGEVLKVLFVGRIEKAKGIYVLADAVPKVEKTHTKVRFIFAGEPRNEKGLADFKSYLNKLGVLGYCEFAGGVTREKLRELYQQCDIFVNPSTIYESFSYTNAEAMACGKPVITSDMGGMPETVGNMIAGLVFRNKDDQDLAGKLLLLISSEELRQKLGDQARERSMQYSVANVTNKIISFYQRVKAN
jgi:glycosyltransferase involved in cell wall biosynthesis